MFLLYNAVYVMVVVHWPDKKLYHFIAKDKNYQTVNDEFGQIVDVPVAGAVVLGWDVYNGSASNIPMP